MKLHEAAGTGLPMTRPDSPSFITDETSGFIWEDGAYVLLGREDILAEDWMVRLPDGYVTSTHDYRLVKHLYEQKQISTADAVIAAAKEYLNPTKPRVVPIYKPINYGGAFYNIPASTYGRWRIQSEYVGRIEIANNLAKCECGSESANTGGHSHWCPKGSK